MNPLMYSILLLCVVAVQGCKTISTEDSAAVIPEHTAESIVELRSAIKIMLHGTPVTIAKTAFNKSHTLRLVRKKILGPDGRPVQTRVDEKPIIFELFISEKKCFLKYPIKNETFQLKQAVCTKYEA